MSLGLTDFQDADLRHSRLLGTMMNAANFRGSDLRDAFTNDRILSLIPKGSIPGLATDQFEGVLRDDSTLSDELRRRFEPEDVLNLMVKPSNVSSPAAGRKPDQSN